MKIFKLFLITFLLIGFMTSCAEEETPVPDPSGDESGTSGGDLDTSGTSGGDPNTSGTSGGESGISGGDSGKDTKVTVTINGSNVDLNANSDPFPTITPPGAALDQKISESKTKTEGVEVATANDSEEESLFFCSWIESWSWTWFCDDPSPSDSGKPKPTTIKPTTTKTNPNPKPKPKPVVEFDPAAVLQKLKTVLSVDLIVKEDLKDQSFSSLKITEEGEGLLIKFRDKDENISCTRINSSEMLIATHGTPSSGDMKAILSLGNEFYFKKIEAIINIKQEDAESLVRITTTSQEDKEAANWSTLKKEKIFQKNKPDTITGNPRVLSLDEDITCPESN